MAVQTYKPTQDAEARGSQQVQALTALWHMLHKTKQTTQIKQKPRSLCLSETETVWWLLPGYRVRQGCCSYRLSTQGDWCGTPLCML